MKLALSVFFVLSSHLLAQYTLIGHATGVTGNGGTGNSGTVNTTGATLLVVMLGAGGTGATVTDNKGNSWNSLPIVQGSGGSSQIWYANGGLSVGSGNYVTVSGLNLAGFSFSAWKGGSTSGAYSNQNGAFATATTIQPGSITPVGPYSLIVTSLGGYSFTGTISSGFTVMDSIPLTGGQNYAFSCAYSIQSGGASATNPTWTAGFSYLAATIASFKASPMPSQGIIF